MIPTIDHNNSIQKFQLLQTVGKIWKYLTTKQKNSVKKAQKLYEAMGTPTTQNLKEMIRMSLIINIEVTTEDVNLAIKVFGPDIGAIKGKTTRSKPSPVTSNIVDIPTELTETHENTTLSIDGTVVNSLKFLTIISHNIQYRTVQYVGSGTAAV